MSADIVSTAIVDGDPLFCEGIRRIFEGTRYSVKVVAPSMRELMPHSDNLDLVLLLGLPDDQSHLAAILQDLRSKWPKARVVAIAEYSVEMLVASLNAGLYGCLSRNISAEALLRFLSLILLGQTVFSTKSVDLFNHFAEARDFQVVDASSTDGINTDALTKRERDLLDLLMEGQPNKMIARRLGVAEATVKTQMVRLFNKIGATNRTQAAVLWRSHWAIGAKDPLVARAVSRKRRISPKLAQFRD